MELIRRHPLASLAALAAVSLIGLAFVPPFPQPQDYHRFADQRTLLGIPHFWNVASNLAFLLVGALGLVRVRRLTALVFFLGVFLTAFSSSWYHLDPNDRGLFWDRLPMSVAFMALLANVIEERLDARVGRMLLFPLVALGVASLVVWLKTGDLRLYGWVQFFPCVALPLIIVLVTPQRSDNSYWFAAAALYLIAKLFEFADGAVFTALHVMAGHALKHVAAAGACYAIYRAMTTAPARK